MFLLSHMSDQQSKNTHCTIMGNEEKLRFTFEKLNMDAVLHN